jgi:hypothetical protein
VKNKVFFFPAQRLSLFSYFRQCVLFLARAPASSRSVFPALLVIFLAPVVISAQGAPVFLSSAYTVFWPLGPISSPPSAFDSVCARSESAPSRVFFFLGGRWRFLAARPPSFSHDSVLQLDLFPPQQLLGPDLTAVMIFWCSLTRLGISGRS